MLPIGLVMVLCAAAPALGSAWPPPAPVPTVPHGVPAVGFLDSAADEFPPPPGDDRGYDVLHYDLDVSLDPASRSIVGTVEIRLRALAMLSAVLLDLVPEMACEAVHAGGAAAAYMRDGDSLRVELPALLPAGAETTVRVSWRGVPPVHGGLRVGLMFRLHNAGTRDDPDDDVPIVFNVSQPWSAHSWWPCKDHPSDKALLNLAITVPDTLHAVGNGHRVAESVPEPGLVRTEWREDYPIAPYLVAVAVSNYESWYEDCFVPDADPPGRPVCLEYHVFPPDRAVAEADLAPTCRMMQFLTDLAGPYPFAGEKYAQAEIKWSGAMENQTMTGVSQFLLTGDGRWETLILHEMSHHWFGNSLTPAVWADIWLNEGLARYCEALWVEHEYGAAAYRGFMREIGVERHETLFVGEGTLADPDPILPNHLIYDKGAWVLHLLRGMLGDEAFFAFVRSYAGNPELVHGSVTTADLIAAAEAGAGRDLGGFFGPWLETDQVPRITASSRTLDTGSSLGRVEVVLRQTQDPLFEVPVPVVIHWPGGRRLETIRLTRREQTFDFTVPGPVDSVRIDPDRMSLLVSATLPPFALTVTGPTPNPVSGAGGLFEINLRRSMEVFVKTYDVRGHLVHQESLGSLVGGENAPPTYYRWPDPAADRPRPASGVYWVEFLADGLRAVRKAVLVH